MQHRFEDALADEVHRMLEDGVVQHVEEIDLGLILGAATRSRPAHQPVPRPLRRSERVFGGRFHEPRSSGRLALTAAARRERALDRAP